MINLLFYCVLLSVNVTPQNILWDRYTITPPLGEVKSIVTSPLNIFAISDNYLIVFDKQDFTVKKTLHFDQEIELIGYDQQYDDLWISGASSIMRLTVATYTLREYPFVDDIHRLGIGKDYLYLDAVRNYSLNKRTGEIKEIHSFSGDSKWHMRITESDIRNYTFLTPYYYYDESEESQAPFSQFPITALYDDGMYLYVGTYRYGILKYNKVSWQKERIIYGPLDLDLRKVRKFDNNIYFVSSLGVSHYQIGAGNWHYQRFTHQIADILFFENNFLVSFENHISRVDGNMIFRISTIGADILCLNSDNTYIYVGTNSGLLKIYKGTNEPIPFGPDRHSIYSVYSTENNVFAGGEFGFYQYNKEKKVWAKVLPFGVKDIISIEDDLYLLGVNNQIIKYNKSEQDLPSSDTSWILLPYFNIYDIDTDNEVLYCASYAGIYYYEPKTELYKVVYNLPRVKYEYVFVADTDIIAVTDKNIYSLPIEFRD